MDFFRFIFSKRFLKHLGWMAVVSTILIITFSIWLGLYTGHKRYIVVPDLIGKLLQNVKESDEFSDFQFIVVDSVYESGMTPGTIINQEPAKNSNVKHNRKIYLTIISSMPDMVKMPDLKFLTLRQATSMLESYGLKLGTISYTRSFDEDAVQAQYFEGKPVKPEAKLYKGSIIDLVVGLGSRGTQNSADTLGGDDADDESDTLVDEL